jgi:hypothetical protein
MLGKRPGQILCLIDQKARMAKTALITGVTGQGGAFPAAMPGAGRAGRRAEP